MPSTDRRLELKAKDIDGSDRLTAGCVCQWVKICAAYADCESLFLIYLTHSWYLVQIAASLSNIGTLTCKTSHSFIVLGVFKLKISYTMSVLWKAICTLLCLSKLVTLHVGGLQYVNNAHFLGLYVVLLWGRINSFYGVFQGLIFE